MKNNGNKLWYLAEGEVPPNVPVIYVASVAASPRAPDGESPKVRRFTCSGRLGAKVQDTAAGPLIIESAS